jgi:hypothetical protein
MARADLDLNDAFSRKDRERLRLVCRYLRTSYKEFIVFAVRAALDEMEGYAEHSRNNAGFWNRND